MPTLPVNTRTYHWVTCPDCGKRRYYNRKQNPDKNTRCSSCAQKANRNSVGGAAALREAKERTDT